jgi:ATP-binding cassette subfamily B protein
VTVSAKAHPADDEALLAVLQDGDYFGEIALIDDAPRMATVRTRTDCVFLTLPCDAFLKLLDNSPDLQRKFEQVSAERLAASRNPAPAGSSATASPPSF